VPWPWPTC